MSGNDDEKKGPESLAPRASTVPPNPTRPPPPSERRSTSVPPPPPRRSVKPSGPPPPPPRLPRGQRLAGVFSTPPPPVEEAPAPSFAAAPVALPTTAAPPPPPPEPVAVAPVVAEPPLSSHGAPEPHSPEPLPAQSTLPLPEVDSPAPVPTPAHADSPVRSEPANEAPRVAAFAAAEEAPAPSALEPLPSESAAPRAEAAPSFPPPIPALVPAPLVSPALSTSLRPPAPSPALSGASVSARLTAAQARLVAAIPPPWLELARKQPVLWMVVAPVTFATLLVLLAVALAPEVETARPEPLVRATPTSAAPPPAETKPGAAPDSGPAAPDGALLAALEAKSPDALSVDEVLVVKQHRADGKRKEAQQLAGKLVQQPDLANEAAVQRELVRLAYDPDTSDVALSALARASSPVAKDLLYEVWTSRSVPVATAELAGSLLASRGARESASAALAVALSLRGAGTCEAVQAALPQARNDGDRRSLPTLGKLSSRRGCGADKSEDCYPCLRAGMKQVTATVEAVKRRKAPSYPTH